MGCLHRMKLHSVPFQMIQSGRKTIELRLYDEKRKVIQVGDRILFSNTSSQETLLVKVIQLHRFATFEALYQALPLLQCGYAEDNVGKAMPSDMLQYYSKEQQAKYGVVGIEISLLSEYVSDGI